jgi:hypothetical protein
MGFLYSDGVLVHLLYYWNLANTNICVCLIVIHFQHFKVYFTFFGCTTPK